MLTRRSGRVKTARALRQRKERLAHGLFLAEGAKALTEAMAASGVVEVFATADASAQYDVLRKAADDAGLPWQVADDDAVASLCGATTPPGIVAVCRALDVPFETLVPRSSGTRETLSAGSGPLVVCADVRDPGNAGSIIRTADAAGASAVVLAGQSVDPYNDKTVRATVGSLWHLPIAIHADVADVVRRAQDAGLAVLAADGAGETDLFDADALLDGPHAWLFGNEAHGLPDELASLADHRVAIPIRGRAESLNLATAAAVSLYASARRHS